MKTEITINPLLDRKKQELIFEITEKIPSITNKVTERLSEEVINFKEEAVKKALIELGWTPPGDIHDIVDKKELSNFIAEEIKPLFDEIYKTKSWGKQDVYWYEIVKRLDQLINLKQSQILGQILQIIKGAKKVYGGGYSSDEKRDIYHHGIGTAIRCVEEYIKNKGMDFQNQANYIAGKE